MSKHLDASSQQSQTRSSTTRKPNNKWITLDLAAKNPQKVMISGLPTKGATLEAARLVVHKQPRKMPSANEKNATSLCWNSRSNKRLWRSERLRKREKRDGLVDLQPNAIPLLRAPLLMNEPLIRSRSTPPEGVASLATLPLITRPKPSISSHLTETLKPIATTTTLTTHRVCRGKTRNYEVQL